jgi:hypothetical protein
MRLTPFAVAAVALICLTWCADGAGAQTTRPSGASSSAGGGGGGATTRPAGRSAEEMLNQLLKPAGEARPNAQQQQGGSNVQSGGIDATSGTATVAPGAPAVTLMREGTDIVNRVGRLTRSADGQSWEFTFESDGRSMQDPPVVVLPNLNLMKMESVTGGMSRDLRFRITGEVTEYRGRNYILLRKWIVVSDAEKQF